MGLEDEFKFINETRLTRTIGLIIQGATYASHPHADTSIFVLSVRVAAITAKNSKTWQSYSVCKSTSRKESNY
jgi:hypothetical protein